LFIPYQDVKFCFVSQHGTEAAWTGEYEVTVLRRVVVFHLKVLEKVA